MKKYCTLILLLCLFYQLSQSVIWSKSNITIEEHVEAAQDYMENQQWDYAGYEWRNVLAEDAKNLEANLGLAEVLIKSGFPNDAVEQLKRARLSVRHTLLDTALAQAYEKTGQFQDAADLYYEVLKYDNYQYQAFQGLMRILPKLSQEQSKSLKKFLSDIAAQAKSMAIKVTKNGVYSKAVPYYRIAAIFYNQPAILNDYGLALLLSGNPKEASRQFNKLNIRMKNHCEIKANTAIIMFSLGQNNMAKTIMENSLSLCNEIPVKAQVYNNLGYFYEMSNNRNKARFAYEKAVEIKPTYTKAIMNLAYIYQREKLFKEAISLYETLLLRESANAEVWNRLGFLYEMQGDSKKAIASYKKAISLDSGLKEAYLNLGMLYKKDNKQDEATEILKQMNQVEFSALENNSTTIVSTKLGYASLLKYVDLFFAEPVL